MDFQNVNPLDVRLNIMSGNLLPMTSDENASFPILWRAYSALIWLFMLILNTAVIFGCAKVSTEKVLGDGVICLLYSTEMFVKIMILYARKRRVGRLIGHINDILRVADDTMKDVVRSTLQPIETSLRLYCLGGVVAIIIWSNIPLMSLFKQDVFYYEDYRLPAAIFSQPLSPGNFLLGNIIQSILSVYIFVKTIAADVYMVHMMLITTAQYRYVALKIAMIFRDEDERNVDGGHNASSKTDSSERKRRQMRTLCRHHNTLIHLTLLLKELLSLNFSIMYLSQVMQFCILGCMIAITTSWEKMLVTMYTLGATVQLYILCFCVQKLLDASMEVTDKAFHQKWYLSKAPMKSIFLLIIMANNLECKVAVVEKFNLSLPSFMTILNQSYSVALLFLKMR